MNTSLEKIQLPDFILADLYKENLVILKKMQVKMWIPIEPEGRIELPTFALRKHCSTD